MLCHSQDIIRETSAPRTAPAPGPSTVSTAETAQPLCRNLNLTIKPRIGVLARAERVPTTERLAKAFAWLRWNRLTGKPGALLYGERTENQQPRAGSWIWTFLQIRSRAFADYLLRRRWWRIRDLNPGPTDYDSAALTTELIRHGLKGANFRLVGAPLSR
jgi:hypothetical protein